MWSDTMITMPGSTSVTERIYTISFIEGEYIRISFIEGEYKPIWR